MFFKSKVKITMVTFVNKWFLLIFLRIIYQRPFICNALIVDIVPFDFEFTISKGMVTRVTFVNVMVFAHYLYPRPFIFHMMIGLGENMSPDVLSSLGQRLRLSLLGSLLG